MAQLMAGLTLVRCWMGNRCAAGTRTSGRTCRLGAPGIAAGGPGTLRFGGGQPTSCWWLEWHRRPAAAADVSERAESRLGTEAGGSWQRARLFAAQLGL